MSEPANILQAAIPPDEAVDILCAKGVKVSERSLREKARRLGCYRQIGRTIFFLPKDLEKLMEPETCSSPSNAGDRRSGLQGGRSTARELRPARSAATTPKQRESASVPPDRDVVVWNSVTGEYRSRYTDGEFPLMFWSGQKGEWFPMPTHWRELSDGPSRHAE